MTSMTMSNTDIECPRIGKRNGNAAAARITIAADAVADVGPRQLPQ